MKKTEQHATFLRRLPIYRALTQMPALSHWPDRSSPFAPERSEIVRFIMAHGVDLEEAQRIYDCARAPGYCEKPFIEFDRETKLWRGTGISITTPRDADSNPQEQREGGRFALVRRLFMKIKRSLSEWVAEATGRGLRVYGERERSQTREALARFNAGLCERRIQGQPAPVANVGGSAND